MKKLSNWCLTKGVPAYRDCESATVLEMTYKLYQAMNNLIDEYNTFASEVSKQIVEFQQKYEKDIETFTTSLRQEFQDFIDVVDLKVATMQETITEAVKVDINAYIGSDEFKQQILSTVNEIITNINAEIKNIKENYLTKEEASSTYAKTSEIEGLINHLDQLEQDITAQINGIENTYLTKEEASSTYAKTSEIENLATKEQVVALEQRIQALEQAPSVAEWDGTYTESDTDPDAPSGYTLHLSCVSGVLNSDLYTYSLDSGATWNQFTSEEIDLENVTKVRFKNTATGYVLRVGTGTSYPNQDNIARITNAESSDIDITENTVWYVVRSLDSSSD